MQFCVFYPTSSPRYGICRRGPRDAPESHPLRAALLRAGLAAKHTAALPGSTEPYLEPASGVNLPSDFWTLNNRTPLLTEECAVEIQPLALQPLFAKAGARI
jgi:hypothetical protein